MADFMTESDEHRELRREVRPNRWNAVITDSVHKDLGPMIEVLEGAGVAHTRIDTGDEEEIVTASRKADALIVQSPNTPVRASLIGALERCRIIIRLGIGLDNVDVEAATKKGIAVANVPDYCEEEVATHAVALLLAYVRKIPLLDREVRKGNWDYRSGGAIRRMSELTVGILGFGRIGRAFAERLRPFGCRLMVSDPYVPGEVAKGLGAFPVSKTDLFRESDAVSIHLPLTGETKGLVDRTLLRSMKPHACIINTSRGLIIDEAALEEALQEGWIGGAALDVLVVEPPPSGNPFAQHENVVLTPHAAWYSETAVRDLLRKGAEEVVRVLQGGRPKALVNPGVRGSHGDR